MARRSSARLAARNSTTPKSLKSADGFQDDRLRTPKTAPQLASVAETDDMPGAFPQSASPADNTPSKLAKHIAIAVTRDVHTPKHKHARPSEEEMHPQRFHASTMKPLNDGRWLGCSEMGSRTEPPKGINKWVPAAETPSKVKNAPDAQPPAFEFTFRAQSLELSNEAQKLMAEKREEAARIKAQMSRIEEEDKAAVDRLGRRIAHPKGKSGRFSDVHLAQFKKMDSIANHPSVARPSSRQKTEINTTLKRTGSKADLAPAEKRTKTRPAGDAEGASPAKRARFESPKTAHAASMIKVATPSVVSHQLSPSKISYPNLATQASLARNHTTNAGSSSVAPSLLRTPSKSAVKQPFTNSHSKNSLFARSPTKFAHMSAKKEVSRLDQGTPMLARSPSKVMFSPSPSAKKGNADVKGDKIPMLSRAPLKPITLDASGGAGTSLSSASVMQVATDGGPPSVLKSTSSGQTNLMDRFQSLRKSPVKSILRSPQRQYSNDPLKIASGTHLATPPPNKFAQADGLVPRFGAVCPATEPVKKRVDFTASTKDADDSPIPCAKSILGHGAGYPGLPSEQDRVRRRQTLGPLESKDFTFRMGDGIVFGPSPSATKASPKPSIRHISAEPEVASSSMQRKRKFVDEPERLSDGPSDKENDANAANAAAAAPDAVRPAKRAKQAASVEKKTAAESKAAAAAAVPSWAQGTAAQKARAALAHKHVSKPRGQTPHAGKTPGKEEKRGAAHGISRARLEALSQPKRR